jgi:putative SOS response-associated peptidase YedK
MCGRFAQYNPRKIEETFGIKDENNKAPDLPLYYNAAPSLAVRAVVWEKERMIVPLKWELTTLWSGSKNYSLINIRDDNLRAKDAFAENFRSERCIIPADGFFEWRKTGGRKPFFIRLKSGELMALAGLFSGSGENASCAIITTAANSLLELIHDKKRMPVILPEKRWEAWLDNASFDRKLLLSFLEPYPAEEMEAYAVTDEVNSTRDNRPEYVVRAGELYG